MVKTDWYGRSLNGRYKIEALLGQGGMSSVYKAYDPNLMRAVAIKLIHPHLSSDDDFIRRFKNEAASVAAFRHPNIVQVYDFNIDGDVYYMVLEYIAGETLQDRLNGLKKNNAKIPIEQAARITIDICNALSYAHKRNAIHRDIKPANIMLDPQGQAILMDFGIVKIVGASVHTATGAVVGTARYMSPDVIRGESVDERSDLYSLGVTLFEMVSGEPPFDADSTISLLMRHMNDPVPDIMTLRSDVPPELSRIILKSMEKKREDRYRSAVEMAADLQELLLTLEPAPVSQPFIPHQPAPPPPAEQVREQPVYATEQWTASQPLPTSADSFLGNPTESVAAAPATNLAQGYQPGAGVSDVVNSYATVIDPPTPQPALQPARVEPSFKTVTSAPTAWHPAASPWLKYLGAGAFLFLFFAVMLVVGGWFVFKNFFPASAPPLATATQTSPPPESTATFPVILPTNTETPKLTATHEPTATITPSPTATLPPLYARINSISINATNNYVVEYETFGYTETLPGMHIHFFFDTVSVEQAGSPGSGPWKLYGGPRPFTGYRVSDRPAGATQLCVLVANANHSIIRDSGNCFVLP